MKDQFQLEATQRTDIGKGASRRLRRLQDQVPCIVYGGEKEPASIMIEHRHIAKAIKNEAFFSHLIQLQIDGNPEKVLIKALQRHPFKQRVLHVDFQRVSAKDILHRHVPLHFINESKAPGLKAGGIVTHNLKDIEITCAAEHLPEYIEVDLSGLELDHSLHLSALVLPPHVKLAITVVKGDEHDQTVASITTPRVAVEEETPVEQAEVSEETPKAESAEAKKSDENA